MVELGVRGDVETALLPQLSQDGAEDTEAGPLGASVPVQMWGGGEGGQRGMGG